jgi:oligopeptidase B
MNKSDKIILTVATIAIIYCLSQIYKLMNEKPVTPPIAKKISHVVNIHGQKIEDDYSWMRDSAWPNKVENTDIIEYLNGENLFTKTYFAGMRYYTTTVFEELKARIKLDDISAYIKRKQYYYYTRTEKDKDYPIYCRKESNIDNNEQIILDVNLLALDKQFTNVGTIAISEDQNLMSYAVDFSGDEKYSIKIYDLKNNQYFIDEIENVASNIVWHKNLKGFFYVSINESLRQDAVKFHILGESIQDDKIILKIDDPLYQLSINKSASGDYLFINKNGHSQNEIYSLAINAEYLVESKLTIPSKDKIFYDIEHHGDYFYIRTNEQAENFKLTKIAIDNVENYEKAKEDYITEKKDKYLSSFDVTENYLILNYKANALPYIQIKHFKTGEEKLLMFPDIAFEADAFSTNFELDDIRIDYSSLAMPRTIYQYDFDKSHLSILKTDEIPSGFKPEEYVVERIFILSGDVRVPVTLMYKKSMMQKDGTNALYLYGYGSYGISTPVSFRSSAISLVDRGFVYAIAHVRGGSELGQNWYESAKFLTKKHSFDDFIASAKALIDLGYTAKGKIVISGGSAGGMLIGYAINEYPELFKAAVAHVPFVDVLNTMLDETLPLTPGEFQEWGNPANVEYFEYIRSYSPYDNIKAQNYPNVFMTAGISDPRVGYWEPAKFIAKLRVFNSAKNKILLKTNMDSGHKGASGRFDYLKEIAEELSFIFHVSGTYF